MSDSGLEQQRRALSQLKQQVARLEAEIADREVPAAWAPQRFYSAFFAMTGFVLGGVAAMASLLFSAAGGSSEWLVFAGCVSDSGAGDGA